MAAQGPLLDQFARLMTGAAGFAQGMQREAEHVFEARFERWLAGRDLPTREEVEALRDTVRRLDDEKGALETRVAALEAALAAGPPPPPAGEDRQSEPSFASARPESAADENSQPGPSFVSARPEPAVDEKPQPGPSFVSARPEPAADENPQPESSFASAQPSLEEPVVEEDLQPEMEPETDASLFDEEPSAA